MVGDETVCSGGALLFEHLIARLLNNCNVVRSGRGDVVVIYTAYSKYVGGNFMSDTAIKSTLTLKSRYNNRISSGPTHLSSHMSIHFVLR